MRGQTRTAFLGGAGAAALAPLAAAAQQPPTVIRATSAIDDPATPFLYALESGLFKRNGIDASIERSTSGAAAAAAVIGGSFEIGKSSVISLLSAFVRGLPLIAVQPAGEYDSAKPNYVIAVKIDSPIRTGADLNGRTVAVSALGDLFSISLRAWVDQHGGDSATVKLIELPMSSVTQAITSGRVDAAVLIQPFLAQALAANAVKSIGDPVAALGNRHTDSIWFTTVDYTKKNPDAVARFIRSMRESAAYVNGHPAETAPLLMKFAKVDATDAATVRVLQGIRLDPATMQPMIDAAAKYNVIAKRFDAKDLIYPPAMR